MKPSKADIEGMRITVSESILNKNITADMMVKGQKVGYVRFSRVTESTYLFELNVRGKRVGLTYTTGVGHTKGYGTVEPRVGVDMNPKS